ncbi:Hypothetical protein A7982_02124 [Minicystis rosea]|nr:Hypothetical protein A7982_02124 [Minicystis rosea]
MSVNTLKACAITKGGTLFCLEALDGNPEPNRRLMRATGSFTAVDLHGFPWAVTSAGVAVQSEVGGDFSKIEERVPGHFSSVMSDGWIACGVEAGKIRCISKRAESLQEYAPPVLGTVERIVPGSGYYCALAGGRATCFGRTEKIPGGPLEDVAARDLTAEAALLCIVDAEGTLRCRGDVVK